MTAPPRVLVTGATGFVGRQVLAPLLGRGFEVHAVSSRGEPREGGQVAWHHADLLEPTAAPTLVEAVAPTHLLHLAWYAEPGKYWRSAENLRWVEASLALLRAFAEFGAPPRRVVVAGTSAEYAWSQRTHCVEGETPLEPATLYGTSKHALHLVAERFAAEAGLSLAWGRIFFAYGPGESPSRLAGSVARALVRGEPAKTTHGEQVRDFLHTADLADAFATLLASDVEGPVNMASGEPVRVRDLVEALARAAGRPDLVRLGARHASADEPAELTADGRRLHKEVGWGPKLGLVDGAAQTIAWWAADQPG
ncbi:MAG: NAD-dependent epimerase/dehydratase family protein [Solirubrobacteraceae bacterium]